MQARNPELSTSLHHLRLPQERNDDLALQRRRGGEKLDKALYDFDADVEGLIALDAGLSTGGFAECLLKWGARRVYGVDSGRGQVHERLVNDERVCVHERTNLRHLDQLPEPIDVATIDLSFISVLKVAPALRSLLRPGAL